MQKVAVIIVNWNTDEYLAKCLRSLGESADSELIEEVIVVDNNSSDRSIIKAKQVVGERLNKPRVRFVQNDKNVGFAAANNIGLERVRQMEDSLHVLLLNPDTEIVSGMITHLVEILAREEKAGIVGAQLFNSDKSLQKSVRHFPTKREIVMYMLKLGRLVKEEEIDYEKEQRVDQVMGASLLIRNRVIDEVGRLDERFFVWFEEVDYCKRTKDKGWDVWYTPHAKCLHKGGVSFGQLVGLRKTLPWLKSLIRYTDKHMGGSMLVMIYMLMPINILLSLPASIVHILRMDRYEEE